jgi:hypothetical protein
MGRYGVNYTDLCEEVDRLCLAPPQCPAIYESSLIECLVRRDLF